MKIIDFESKSWFFLSDNTDYYIDVSCNLSFVGFNMLIRLDSLELNEYHSRGSVYLSSLAKDIQQLALSKYSERNIKGPAERLANEAVIKFLEEGRNTDINNQNI
jgi:hypothetical protein